MRNNAVKTSQGSLASIIWLLVLMYSATNCQSKKQVEEAREISGINTETSDIIISDSAAKQTQGVKLGQSWIIPDHVILENISEPTSIQRFNKLLKSSELIKTLKGRGPFTLFIPTDSAFEQLDSGSKQQLFTRNNKEDQLQIIKHHLVSGKIVTSDLKDQVVLKAADGNELQIKNNGQVIQVDNATIIVKDGVSTNGVIHVIDRVLLPDAGD
ncbi:fasciclin domain-containing protein [Adhaeribacter pallidiroseus]|uniref:FAS1 domain-containing protein n=1 Tax=Adhaeribacter pallidiroseus TaxID=2072847 RepID=A0A369QFQ1_9BACT|nr:fasciclin domain-containing protein [Adhaeribacter pallidiroseus]RDC63524.1 uncharacterized protein AHMF7616_02129 [Adhaeribacter pallidiroseus]